MSRAVNHQRVVALRAQGMTPAQIIDHTGLSASYVYELLTDPDGSKAKARKDTYRQPCVDCGIITGGDDGRRKLPRCVSCTNARTGRAAKHWDRAAIIACLQAWAAEHGEPPCLHDWTCYQRNAARGKARADRYRRLRATNAVPSKSTVIKEFDSWNAAIEAAGLVPRAAHGGNGNELRTRRARRAA